MITIGFADNNKVIESVRERIMSEGIFQTKIYNSVESAIEDLLSKKIDCLIGGHDMSTAEYLKRIFKIIKPKNRIYSYSVLKKDNQIYFFADTGINITLSNSQKIELENLLKNEVGKFFDIHIAKLGFKTDNETLQVDAALFPEIAEKKGIKDSKVHNTFIFPDLHSANIGYKMIQHLGGYEHIGPILLGIGYYISDLSRGASQKEIYDTAIYLGNLTLKSTKEKA